MSVQLQNMFQQITSSVGYFLGTLNLYILSFVCTNVGNEFGLIWHYRFDQRFSNGECIWQQFKWYATVFEKQNVYFLNI